MATAPAPTVWSVVRDILTANISLTADEVITKAKAKGLKAPDAVVRGTVHTVRKKLKQKAATPAPKPVPAAARQTAAPATSATPSVSSIVRSLLSADPTLTADQVIVKFDTRGLSASDATIRSAVHNVRSELKKGEAKPSPAPKSSPAPKAVPAPKAAVAEPKPAAVVAPSAPAPSPTVGLTDVLSNVALVNGAVAASGGVEQARKVAEAVRACGGPEAFAQYLDLVAGIRTA